MNQSQIMNLSVIRNGNQTFLDQMISYIEENSENVVQVKALTEFINGNEYDSDAVQQDIMHLKQNQSNIHRDNSKNITVCIPDFVKKLDSIFVFRMVTSSS